MITALVQTSDFIGGMETNSAFPYLGRCELKMEVRKEVKGDVDKWPFLIDMCYLDREGCEIHKFSGIVQCRV